MGTSTAIISFLLAWAGALILGRKRPEWAPWAGCAAVVVGGVLFAAAARGGGGSAIDVPWLAVLGSRLHLALDPLGAAIAVFAAGVGAVVLAYAQAYFRAHHTSARVVERFTRLFTSFFAAMLLLLLAQDLLVLFVALELTAIASFLLIGLKGDGAETRRAASFALIVTAGSSLFFLVGTVWIASAVGTTALFELAPLAAGGALPAGAIACLAAGVLAKSAQVPLHVWLPRAMVAPTPVSAYLHSAALVAAGVFVLLRLHALIAAVPLLVDALLAVACASILVGSALALTSDRLKRILAYSTIAQLGYVLVLIALGAAYGPLDVEAGPGAALDPKAAYGIAGAALVIVAHGICKAALFMTAGAVTTATGADRLSQARGVLRGRPVLAVASFVAAAGLAGLPLTFGYWKDDMLLEAAHARGPLAFAAAGVAVALTFAYTARFWGGLMFAARPEPGLEPEPRNTAAMHPLLVAPIAVLALAVVALAPIAERLAPIFARAGGAAADPTGAHGALEFELATPFDARIANQVAWGAWLAGLALVLTSRRWTPWLARVNAAGARVGAARANDRATGLAWRASNRLHGLELRDLRDRLTAVIVPVVLLLGVGLAAERRWPSAIGAPLFSDAGKIVALALAACAAVASARARGHVTLVLLMSFSGFALALFFALSGAPDVALVVALVETALTLLFLALLAHLPAATVRKALELGERRRRLGWAGIFAGILGALLAWYALATPGSSPIARAYLERTEEAHGKDVVTVILADFRGLDTAGEITVLAVAVLGAAAIQWRKRA